MLARLGLVLLLILNIGVGLTGSHPQVRARKDASSIDTSAPDLWGVSATDDANDDGIDGFTSVHAVNGLAIAVAGTGTSGGVVFVTDLAIQDARPGWVPGRGCQSNC